MAYLRRCITKLSVVSHIRRVAVAGGPRDSVVNFLGYMPLYMPFIMTMLSASATVHLPDALLLGEVYNGEGTSPV